jgi:hypothetical protein
MNRAGNLRTLRLFLLSSSDAYLPFLIGQTVAGVSQHFQCLLGVACKHDCIVSCNVAVRICNISAALRQHAHALPPNPGLHIRPTRLCDSKRYRDGTTCDNAEKQMFSFVQTRAIRRHGR